MKSVVNLTEDNFETEVLGHNGPVLVEFSAEWSGVCQYMDPVFESLAGSGIKLCRVDADEEKNLAGINKIGVLPTFIAYENGQKTKISTGARNRQELLNLVSQERI